MSIASLEHQHLPDAFADFRVRTTRAAAILGLIFLVPFGVANAFRGDVVLGLGAVFVVLVLSGLAWFSDDNGYSGLSLVLLPPVVVFLAISVIEQGVIGVMWTYPGIFLFYFILREELAWLANAVIVAVVVPIAIANLTPSIAVRSVVTLCVMSVFAILAVRIIDTQQRRLEHVAVTDSLTGMLNRNLLTPTLRQSISRSTRTHEPASLLILDIDHFKRINDTHGHMIGDKVLQGVATLMRNRLRASDQVFRVGGEEFAIVLTDTSVEPARHVADLLRSEIEAARFAGDIGVTASFGLAVLRSEDEPGSWLARADRSLYEAKRGGRNQVVVADGP